MSLHFGVFDHLDRGAVPLAEFYENRLKLIEAYDRHGFYIYCAPSTTRRRSASRRRPEFFSRRSPRARKGSASARWSIRCRSITRCG